MKQTKDNITFWLSQIEQCVTKVSACVPFATCGVTFDTCSPNNLFAGFKQASVLCKSLVDGATYHIPVNWIDRGGTHTAYSFALECFAFVSSIHSLRCYICVIVCQ